MSGCLHIIESTTPLAVDTLAVIGSDNNVAECCSVLQDEHGVFLTTFSLLIASGWVAVPLVHATVEGGTGCDGLDGSEVGGTGGVWEGCLQVCIGRSGRD